MVGDRDEAADKLQALRIGADDYIAKPFKPAEVTASIQTILRRSGGGRAAKTLRVGPLEVQLENYLAAILTPSSMPACCRRMSAQWCRPCRTAMAASS